MNILSIRRVFLGILSCIVLSGCSMIQSRSAVTDCTKPGTIVLRKTPSQGSVHGLSIEGSGKIAGKAEVHLLLDGSVYKKQDLDGAVSFEWNNDWYCDSAEIRYVPHSVSTGTVIFFYRFRD